MNKSEKKQITTIAAISDIHSNIFINIKTAKALLEQADNIN